MSFNDLSHHALVVVVALSAAASQDAVHDKGVDVSDIQHFDNGAWVDGPGGDWNSFVFFSDPDGNGWVIQESPTS